MANYNTVITNEGAALLASVIANQGTLTLTEMRFSTNDYSGSEATLTYGTFSGVFITAAAAGSVVDSTTIKAASQFDNSTLVGDNPLYSIGLVGTDGNTTALIAVSTTTAPDIIRPAVTGVSTYAFNMNLTVSSTNNITVVGTTAAVLYDVDVVDTLISTATDKPLSANQGRVLEQQAEAGFNVLGAKNLGIPLLDLTYLNLSTSNNSDGSLTVTTNGLMCGGVNINWSSPFILKKGTYQVSFGLDTDETPSLTGFAVILKVYSTSYWLCTSGDSAASRKITLASDTEVVWGMYCESGTVVATQTVYPMIRPASIVDPTFAPYAKTNQQLTADKAERSDLATLNLTGSTNTTGSTINKDTYFYLNGSYCKAKTSIANGATFTLNTNFEVTSVGKELKDALDYSGEYTVSGIPFASSYGGIFISLFLPIPKKLRNLYSYTFSDVYLGGGNFSSELLTIGSGDAISANLDTIKLTSTLANYFATPGAQFNSLSALVSANASITLTVTVQ